MVGRKKIVDLVVQKLPPAHDAIGEYTSFLACELAVNHKVRVLTSRDEQFHEIAKVEIRPCFSLNGFCRFTELERVLLRSDADSVVLQYNPFAWGNRGWALDLTRLMKRVKRARPDLVIATMFHERYPPATELRFRLMRVWQVMQYVSLCDSADIKFFSTGLWASEEMNRDSSSPSVHLPVGANLPSVTGNRKDTRRIYGIPENALVLGVFGGAHVSKQLDWVKAAVLAVSQLELDRPVLAFHVGGETQAVRSQLSGAPLIQAGRLSPHDAALAIGAMDILLNPLLDGVSTRRGSTIAGLQNGIAVATTSGFNTEPLWLSKEASGVTLTPIGNKTEWLSAVCSLARNPERLANAGKLNRKLFENHFDWYSIANSMMSQLDKIETQLSIGSKR